MKSPLGTSPLPLPRLQSFVGAMLALVAQTAYADGAAERSAVIARLIAKGTANSLAAAAVLKQFGEESDNGSYPLVARAVQLAPDRRDLAWLAVRLCASSSDCDAAGPEKHLHDIDPGNGIGSTGALTRAQRKNDTAGIDSALTAIGNSDRFYVYFDPLVAATAIELAAAQHQGPGQPAGSNQPARSAPPAASARPAPSGQPAGLGPSARSGQPVGSGSPARTGPSSGSAALAGKEIARATVEMIGVIAASVLPPSQSFSYSCKGLALEQVSGRLERCRRAAQAFARADTFIVEGLGLSLQQQLWPLDSPEGASITAQRRVFQYRLEEYSRLNISSSKVDEFPPDTVDVFRAHEREQDAALVYFTEAGVPPDPPPKWISRSLPRVP
jgi:hypothetical protein